MNIEQLKELGISKEDVLKKVGDKLSEDAKGWLIESEISAAIHKAYKEKLDEVTEKLLPTIEKIIINLEFDDTSIFGELKGPSKTFLEFISSKVDEILNEKVTVNNAGQEDRHGYNSIKRIDFLFKKQMQEQIQLDAKLNMEEIANIKLPVIAEALTRTMNDTLAKLEKIKK